MIKLKEIGVWDMKKLKKFIALSLLAISLVAFVGCNKTESPKEVVSEYFEDIKFNAENELVNNAIETENGEEEVFTKETEEALKELVKKLEYTVGDEKIDGDKATVNVTVKGVNLLELVTNTMNDAMGATVGAIFSNKEMDDKEINNIVNKTLLENIKKAKVDERKGTVTLNKRDNKWKLSTDDELSKLVLGNVSK